VHEQTKELRMRRQKYNSAAHAQTKTLELRMRKQKAYCANQNSRAAHAQTKIIELHMHKQKHEQVAWLKRALS
jgi:argininosuccinate synthase